MFALVVSHILGPLFATRLIVRHRAAVGQLANTIIIVHDMHSLR